MKVRDDQPDRGSPRLNLLLSCASWQRDPAVDQLPRLLEPLGIASIRVGTCQEAAEVLRATVIHIAVVDLQMPLATGSPAAGGARTLQLLRRLDQPPPTVVMRPPQPAARESARGLVQALREGAFAVLDQPVRLESMLEVMRRILRRHYADGWPGERPAPPDWSTN